MGGILIMAEHLQGRLHDISREMIGAAVKLKESLGGLRDLTVMRAIAASWVTDVPRASLTGPHQLLLDVRDALHTTTGRGSDKLMRQEQPGVAALLGIPDPNGDGDPAGTEILGGHDRSSPL